MTAQALDRIKIGDETYALVGASGSLFDPREHGLAPRMIHTACWRGWIATFAVTPGQELLLDELEVGPGSEVNGVRIEPGTSFLGVTADDRLHFRGIGWRPAFTGSLLAGADFVQALYEHMGYAPAWKFARVLELTVVDGRVTATSDRSADMARTRADPVKPPAH